MTKKDALRYKKLQQQWRALRKQINKCEAQIEHLEKKHEQEKRDKILGKCFALRLGRSPECDFGFGRVEYFSDYDYKPMGTKVQFFEEDGERNGVALEFNAILFEDQIVHGFRIPNERFNKYLREAQKLIKFK